MIHSLSIQNIALINNINIHFKPGLNIISGETGTGKSILVRTMNFFLEGKITPDFIRQKKTKASITITFNLTSNSPIQNLLNQLGIKNKNKLTIQKEVYIEGKNCNYINSNPTTNNNIKKISEYLLDISSQHAQQDFLKPQYHIELLDQFANLIPQRKKLKQYFQQYKNIESELQKTLQNENEKQIELHQFIIQEIQQSNIQINEEEQIIQKLQTLQHFEKLSEYINQSYENIYQKENAAISLIENSLNILESAKKKKVPTATLR